MEHRHEKQVQQHIEHAGGGQGHEGDLRLPHAAENGRLEVIQQDHRHTRQVDAQVQQRQGQHIRRDIQQAQKRRGHQLTHQGHQNAPQH